MRITQNSFPNRKSRRLKGWSRNMAASPWTETASMTHRQWRAQAWALPWARLAATRRSEEHTSEFQSLMGNSYAVFRLQANKIPPPQPTVQHICIERQI